MKQPIAPYVLLGAFAVFALTGPSLGQTPMPTEKTGLAIGQKAPGFKLKGADGKSYSLEELLAKGKVALVFERSADW